MTGNSLLCEGSFAAWVPSGAVASGGGCGGGRGLGGGWIERTVYGLRSVNVTRNSLR